MIQSYGTFCYNRVSVYNHKSNLSFILHILQLLILLLHNFAIIILSKEILKTYHRLKIVLFYGLL